MYKLLKSETASVICSFRMHLTESSNIMDLRDYHQIIPTSSEENENHLMMKIRWKMTVNDSLKVNDIRCTWGLYHNFSIKFCQHNISSLRPQINLVMIFSSSVNENILQNIKALSGVELAGIYLVCTRNLIWQMQIHRAAATYCSTLSQII